MWQKALEEFTGECRKCWVKLKTLVNKTVYLVYIRKLLRYLYFCLGNPHPCVLGSSQNCQLGRPHPPRTSCSIQYSEEGGINHRKGLFLNCSKIILPAAVRIAPPPRHCSIAPRITSAVLRAPPLKTPRHLQGTMWCRE